ncbi:MAG TPA: hypothetical protein VJA86_03605 [Candidatus Nanoarchaeia archaeon]|nr:hypothetical protein [Candidatus Woesearchaeota archaeon]HLD37648.1 hypothetical protein [Candidatus Nanoarchaeia archaeon]
MKCLSSIASFFSKKEESQEVKVLRKYAKGRLIDSEDKYYIDRMSRVGLMTTGYSPREKRLTARTLSLGVEYILCAN